MAENQNDNDVNNISDNNNDNNNNQQQQKQQPQQSQQVPSSPQPPPATVSNKDNAVTIQVTKNSGIISRSPILLLLF